VTTWLNTSFEMQFRVIDGLMIRYAQSEDHSDHALLLSPWPGQIIADAHDTTVPPADAEFLHKRLPYSNLDIIDVGHFTREDAAAEYYGLITSWWRGDYAASGPR
jgi:pimeloyl-ACP methyl ester carboxylesterase